MVEADLYVVGQFFEEMNANKEAHPVVGSVHCAEGIDGRRDRAGERVGMCVRVRRESPSGRRLPPHSSTHLRYDPCRGSQHQYLPPRPLTSRPPQRDSLLSSDTQRPPPPASSRVRLRRRPPSPRGVPLLHRPLRVRHSSLHPRSVPGFPSFLPQP